MYSATASDILHLSRLLNPSSAEDFGIHDNLNHSAASDIHQNIISPEKDISKPSAQPPIPALVNDLTDDENYRDNKDKIKPEYEIIYKQKVTPSDVFLQLTGKDPGSHSCECIAVKIKLPGARSKDDISLKISDTVLICKTEEYYLNVNFPRDVKPETSSAKWDPSLEVLNVTAFFDESNIFHL